MTKGFLLFIILLCLLVPALAAGEVYPWKSYSLEPEFSSSLLHSPSDDSWGGLLETGLSVEDLIPNVRFSLIGGYGFIHPEEDVIHIPSLSVLGGIRLLASGPFSLWPRLGVQLSGPVEDGTVSYSPALRCGLVTDIRLWKRHYLQLTAEAMFPAKGNLNPIFSLGLGIKHSLPLMIDLPPADLNLRAGPSPFSPDGDGHDDVLLVDLSSVHPRSFRSWHVRIQTARGNILWEQSGTGAAPEHFEWGGYGESGLLVSSAEDYEVVAEGVDLLGNRLERRVSFVTDIFVYEERGRLKIRVPGILFPPNSTDFTLLREEEQQRNRDVIARVAETLKKFPEYRVRIEGHGNLMSWDDPDRGRKEQVEELVPLSRGRAAEVRRILVREGISYRRVDVAGMGGAYPLVPFGDEEARWMNRRVEFILLK